MAKKSRYQIVNRGRKGSPAYYVSRNDNMGVYIPGAKYRAEGYLSHAREMERDNAEMEASWDNKGDQK